MRQVVGKQTLEVDAATFAKLRANYVRVLVDLGTGDGKHVLAEARRHPDTLVVGIDASPDAMRRTAARAAAKPARGGTPNALFVWAAVEQLPPELTDVDEVHVLMPWGSLLRALVAPDPTVLDGIAAAGADASFLLTLNLHAWRPPVPEVGSTAEPTPDSLQFPGWTVDEVRYAERADIEAQGTSWTKRLGSSREDLAVLLVRGRLS